MVSINGDLPQQQQQNQRLNNNDDDREYDNRQQQEQQELQPEMQRVPYRLHKQTVNGNFATLGSDCPLLRDYLATKDGPGWTAMKVIVAFVRGFSQCVFANNPISGVILMGSVISVAPATFAVCSAAGFLGHLISILLREPKVNLDNGLAVFNPLIFGSVSYTFVPLVYSPGFDGFSISLALLCVVFIAYFWRGCGHGSYPCLTMPFNLAELLLLFVLKNAQDRINLASAAAALVNDAANGTTEQLAIVENVTTLVMNAATSPDWGMVFRGSIVSASQLFVVDNVALGAIIYLSVLIYSPFTCLFGYLGALGGSLVGIQMGAPLDTVYRGLWGFNSYLTAASLGGSFLVVNGQVACATVVSVLCTGVIQHVMQIIFAPVGLPVGTIPFVLTTWLFIGLGRSPEGTFPYPVTMSSPEGQRIEYLAKRRREKLEKLSQMDDPPEILVLNGKATLM
ncbi:urea transporter 1-like isoform X1 [Trichogramma pretiosum]|uniref:urea transporter 1-like isoform X1 n=1 Tax=Trichogramma pretiosum TaxID=7493 RepID=UPI0006C98C9A|nr:urea transporter 1-like isoform X1 [Trichogramma pretiosum]